MSDECKHGDVACEYCGEWFDFKAIQDFLAEAEAEKEQALKDQREEIERLERAARVLARFSCASCRENHSQEDMSPDCQEEYCTIFEEIELAKKIDKAQKN